MISRKIISDEETLTQEALPMAQVFTAVVQVATGANAQTQDAAPPNFGSLAPKSMSSLTALAGTNGVDAILVHGDQWREIKGNETVNILKDLKTTITKSEKRTVLLNLTNRVVGTTNDTRVGVHHQWNVAPRFDNFAHTLTENHHEKMVVHQPTTTWDVINKYFVRKSIAFTLTGLEFNVKGTKTEAIGMEATYKTICIENKVFVAKKDSLAVADLDIGLHIRGAITEIKAVKLKAAASHIKAIGANLCAGIAANLDSPFA
jgi:hypothetical protein